MYACMYCMRIYVCACIYVYMHVCIYVCMCAYMYVYNIYFSSYVLSGTVGNCPSWEGELSGGELSEEGSVREGNCQGECPFPMFCGRVNTICRASLKVAGLRSIVKNVNNCSWY